VEAWAWSRRDEAVADRSRSPWDAEARRPSHADKRKALQREILLLNLAQYARRS